MSIAETSLNQLCQWRNLQLMDDNVNLISKAFYLILSECSIAVICLAAVIEFVASLGIFYLGILLVSDNGSQNHQLDWIGSSCGICIDGPIALYDNLFETRLSLRHALSC